MENLLIGIRGPWGGSLQPKRRAKRHNCDHDALIVRDFEPLMLDPFAAQDFFGDHFAGSDLRIENSVAKSRVIQPVEVDFKRFIVANVEEKSRHSG
nr:hypothetical protein [uncultured Shinella sp.]